MKTYATPTLDVRGAAVATTLDAAGAFGYVNENLAQLPTEGQLLCQGYKEVTRPLTPSEQEMGQWVDELPCQG